MSANNQVVLVRNPDGTHDVWYDACVDNPFPASAHIIASGISDFTDAYKRAEEAAGEYVEYGIRVVDGPVHELSEDEVDDLFAQEEAARQDDLAMNIANGACKHCSNTYSAVWHGGSECDRDPDNPKKVVQDAMRRQAEFNAVNIGYVARFVVEALSEKFNITRKE